MLATRPNLGSPPASEKEKRCSPNESYRAAVGQREVFFNESAVLLSGQASRNKFTFFVVSIAWIFAKIAGSQVWAGGRPDIGSGGSVQKILKKVKKRLVSPLKPR